MSKVQSAEEVERQAAAVRAQLAALGADIRRRASPAALMDSARASVTSRIGVVPARLSAQAFPVGLVLAGGALGVLATSLFSKRGPPAASVAREPRDAAKGVEGAKLAVPQSVAAAAPQRAPAKAVALSILGVGFGYLGGLLLPETPTEDRMLAQPKAILRDNLDRFLQSHTNGMKHSAFALFGASRYSAATLIGLGLLAQAMAAPTTGKPQR